MRRPKKIASLFCVKIFEWVKGPLIIHSFKNRIEDSFATASDGEGTHFSDPSAHFDKETFDDVGGTNAFPMLLRTIKESQEFLD